MYILFKSHIRQRGVTPPAHLKQSTQFADSNINLHSSLGRDPPNSCLLRTATRPVLPKGQTLTSVLALSFPHYKQCFLV